jgi:hypothetical protein
MKLSEDDGSDARDIAQIAALALLRRERGLNPVPVMSPTPEKRSGGPFKSFSLPRSKQQGS